MSFSTMLPASRTPVPIYKSAPGSFYDSIIVRGKIVDMTGGSAKFFMRPIESRTPTINGATAVVVIPTDGNGKNVRYDWQAGDVATEGPTMAWWQFIAPTLGDSNPRETPEFPLLITDHGPGLGTQTGPIVDGVAAHMPVTLNALRKDSRFGDQWLQQQAEVVKIRVLGPGTTVDAESALNLVLLDWLSKRLAYHLTNPAIDYWSRQQRTITTTQTNEVASFPDMVASLEKLRVRLADELAQEWRDLMLIVPGLPQRKVVPMPVSSLGDPHDPTNPTADYNTARPTAYPRLQTGGFGWGLEFGVWPFP